MVVSGEVLTGIFSILGTILAGVLYIGKRQADARLKDAESRLQDAKTELTRAQGEAAQQTGLVEALRELVRVNQGTATAMAALSQTLKDASDREDANYRALSNHVNANTEFMNSNLLTVAERVNNLKTDLARDIDRLIKLVGGTKDDLEKAMRMLGRLEQVYVIVEDIRRLKTPPPEAQPVITPPLKPIPLGDNHE